MAEDKAANGVAPAGKIEVLEREIDELEAANTEKKEEIKKLNMEIEGMRSDGAEMREKVEEMKKEVARSSEAGKAVQAIATRAAELESEVARLQHDSISEMSAAHEARMEAAELRKALEDRESKVELLEREVKGMKQVNAESEMKVRDLERKFGVLEMKEIEERSKRIRVEEELRDKVDEKEREIVGFRQNIEELEKLVVTKKSELEYWIKEKMILDEILRDSEKKNRDLESLMVQLQEQAQEAEKVIRTMKEKAVEAVNGTVNGIHGEVKGLELQWPVVAAGSGAAIAAVTAVIYLCFGKHR